MIWTAWRQFRTQAVIGAIAFALAAVCLVLLAADIRTHYNALMDCLAKGCGADTVHGFKDRYNAIIQVTDLLLIAVPAVLGVFWGAPLISTELTAGTHRLAWNQSVTRSRWLAVKLAVVGLAAVAFTGVLGLLLTWAASPYDKIEANPFSSTVFGARDIVPFAAAAFTFALGAAAGIVLRRPVTAMGVTLVLFLGVQFVIPSVLRPNYLPAHHTVVQLDARSLSNAKGIKTTKDSVAISGVAIPGAWVISSTEAVDSAGMPPSPDVVTQCFKAREFSDTIECFAKHNLHVTTAYQPPSRYWPFQWIETAINATAATLLVGLCFWWIRRRIS
ncbi:ABC transporter permease subunit [Frankia sp. Cas3]|uniref:ABC transporter permease subunit n=1 Tax=Frankia sp. Cas3 TaxID=3073926 RepID=UPI002AD4A25E|nr:ABC transporter permease subunit [Frankia sp. Cas3]